MSDKLKRHIILYAKFHYPHSKKGALSDLKDLLSIYSGVDRYYYDSKFEAVSIYRVVLDTSLDFAPKHEIINSLRDLFSFNFREQKIQFLPNDVNIEDMISHLLSAIALTSIDEFPYDIGEVDNRIREGMLKLQSETNSIKSGI